MPAWCGGTLETGIGRGFNLALAALPGFTLHSDMSPARIFYEQDLVEPTFDVGPDGSIAVPAPGQATDSPSCPERVAASAIRRWASATSSVNAGPANTHRHDSAAGVGRTFTRRYEAPGRKANG